MWILILTPRRTLDSVAFVCVVGDVRMTKCGTSVRKSDQMIHESTSLSQSHRRRAGRGFPGGTESSTKTELSWYKDALLVKDKEAITGGPHCPDKEPVTFTIMETKNQWIGIGMLIGGDTGNVLKMMISLQSNVDAIINTPAEQDCINTPVARVTSARLCTLSTCWGEKKNKLRNCGILRLTQMRLHIHDLSGKLQGTDAHQDADTWPLNEFLWHSACITICGWCVAMCVWGKYSASGLFNCRERSTIISMGGQIF